MTTTGFLIGILAGIGLIAIVLGVLFIVVLKKIVKNPESFGSSDLGQKQGFQSFISMSREALPNANVQSYVNAKIPLPSPELIVRVAGKKAGVNSYRLEVRLGYKRLDHLKIAEQELSTLGVEYKRTDKGRGLIKLVSDNTRTLDELLNISQVLKDAFTFDLNDGGIEVSESLRK